LPSDSTHLGGTASEQALVLRYLLLLLTEVLIDETLPFSTGTHVLLEQSIHLTNSVARSGIVLLD
jgi:hypothetical protein